MTSFTSSWWRAVLMEDRESMFRRMRNSHDGWHPSLQVSVPATMGDTFLVQVLYKQECANDHSTKIHLKCMCPGISMPSDSSFQ